jgi:hypothetical protein
MNPARFRVERTDSKDWVQPRNSTSRGLVIQPKEKLVLTETFKQLRMRRGIPKFIRNCAKGASIAVEIHSLTGSQ